jgi:hypothetical protein
MSTGQFGRDPRALKRKNGIRETPPRPLVHLVTDNGV